MGFYLDGYVLRPARVATGNARSTGEATSGVDRDHCQPGDHGYDLSTTQPVQVCGDMYLAAVLNRPERAIEEYCIWAATTGNIATGPSDTADYLISGTDVTVIPGSLVVTMPGGVRQEDGTGHFIVRDEGGRDVGSVASITISVITGSSITEHDFPFGTGFTFDSSTGILTLTASSLTSLDGGFSEERGDAVIVVWYALDSIKFWWSRNDPVTARFGWSGKTQRWEPYQGSPPRELGILSADESFTLSPKVTRFEADGSTYLPGDPSEPDGYALLRVGLDPDSSALPVLTLVVSDSEAASEYPFSGTSPDAIVGRTNGILQFNPNTGAILEDRTGLPVWYNPETFVPDADGDMGRLTDAAEAIIVLSPIPGPTDRPLLRFGWRRHLLPVAYAADWLLPSPSSLSAGTFAWSMTTGKVILCLNDIDRATPGSSTANTPPDAADYELPYLGARIYYDGVSMTMMPVPIRYPVALELDNGDPIDGNPETLPSFSDVFVPRAAQLPFPGTSGILYVPDDTGTLPDGTNPETRPNGSGLVRQVEGIGDSFVFAVSTGTDGTYAFADLDVKEYEEDLNALKFRIPKTDAQVARMESSSGPSGASMANFRRRGITDSAAYFIQSQVMPCVYASEVEIWSRLSEPFELTGADTIRMSIGGDTVEWLSSALGEGSFTAEEVAASIQTAADVVGAPASVGHFRGRIRISTTSPVITSVEIGWNVDETDLTGHSVLGLLPGWRVDGAMRWLPDNGMTFGIHRSPENVNAKESTADIAAVGVMNAVLTDNISGVPFVTLSVFPLEDVPGYEEDVHFRVAQGLNIVDLKNYDGIHYEFALDRFAWTATESIVPTAIQVPTEMLQLAAPMVLPDTVSSAAMAPLGTGFGLYLRGPDETATTELEQDTDFLLPGEGAPGQALLVSPVGDLTAQGAAGFFAAGWPDDEHFFDNNISDWEDTDQVPITPEPGYLLRILNGDAEGIYTITGISNAVPIGTFVSRSSLEVEPSFPAGAGPSSGAPYAQWRIYEGFTRDVYDPAVVADVQLDVFNHFLIDPFVIRVLSHMATVSSDNNPVHANASTALQRDRTMFVRFTPSDSLEYDSTTDHATITVLERGIEVGVLAAEGMLIPDTADTHFTFSTLAAGNAYFGLRVGAQSYTAADGNLELVGSFTAPSGNVIQVGAYATSIEGQILVGTEAATEGAAQLVYYDQLPLDPSKIDAGTSQMDPATGDITLSAADITSHSDGRAYFVEQMITENSFDVTTAPLNGAILFNEPLNEGQIVEVSYFQADSNGDKAVDEDSGDELPEITEYLPLIIRLEEATRVDELEYTFNPDGRTVSDTIEAFIWVGVELQNYAGTVTVVVDNDANMLTFTSEVDEGSTVKINYGVLEALGGEQAYSVSTSPVYRKPFFLEEDQDQFELEGDRTDLLVGALLLIGPAPFYIRKTAYDNTTDATTVTIWPSPVTEVGSRSPGKDATTLVTTVPVAVVIDPEGHAFAADGAPGFLMAFSDAVFLPVDKGTLSVSFYGDYREYTRNQHLLEIGGYPMIIVGAILSEDGRYTVVNVANPMQRGFSWDADPSRSDSIRISVRPVYLPNPTRFQGIAPFLDHEEHEAFLLGSVDSDGNELPGTVLVPEIHFSADPSNGDISFIQTSRGPMVGTERLLFRSTRLNQTIPIVVDGAQVNPVYHTKHISVIAPSIDNDLKGSTLAARYVYRSPDTFYSRTVPVELYMPDVAASALAKVTTSSPSGGPLLAFPGTPINYKQGALGLRGTVDNLKDEDRGARNFLEVYNAIVVAFEQVLEAIDGRFIGDRDGKFRLFVGHGKTYAPPGYEDVFSGALNQRNLWRLVVEEWADEAALADGFVEEVDGIYGPTTYVEDTHGGDTPGDIDGWTKSGKQIDLWIELQRARIKNDMDDRILSGLKGGTLLAQIFPWLEVDGEYEDMWEPHQLSRLFPERTLAFTRLFPGLEANPDIEYEGYYSPGRRIEVPGPEPGEVTETVLSTKNSPIGNVSNPVFVGGVPNITDIDVRNRFPRARIWAYYPSGNPALDSALSISTVGFATFVVTPLPFSEFPIDPNTGFPDASQLISNGGALADAVSGDFSLFTPGFEVGDKVDLGHPNLILAGLFGGDEGWANSNRPNIFVDDVQAGCVITVNDGTGSGALPGTSVYTAYTVADITSYSTAEVSRGDTLYCGPPANPFDAEALASEDPPSLEALALAVEALSDYRVQFDIGVSTRRAKFIDKTLSRGWSNDDVFPFNLQNFFNQNPPTPLTAIEADVDFINTGRSPIQVPALKGEAKNDSGDVTIPYMASPNTELEILREVAAAITGFFDYDCLPALLPAPSGISGLMDNELQFWRAIYPDELADAGTIIYPIYDATPDYMNPGVLYTTQNMRPITSTGAYTDSSGEGGLRPFDLLFVEYGQGAVSSGAFPEGVQGVLTVGDVQLTPEAGPYPSGIEIPRFVCQTYRSGLPWTPGDPLHNYTARNAFGNVGADPALGPGVVIEESVGPTAPNNFITTFDFSSIGGLTLDDGFAGGNGGLWNIIELFGNAIKIDFYSTDATLVGDPQLATLVIGSPSIGAPVYARPGPGHPVTEHDLMNADTAGIEIIVGVSGGPMGNMIQLETDMLAGSLLTALGLTAGDYYDFTITVDTYIDQATVDAGAGGGTPLILGAGFGSVTAAVMRDRLTFSERLSFSDALPRGTYPANGDTTNHLGIELNLWSCPINAVATSVQSDVNACAYENVSGGINGGTWVTPTYLTVQERIGPSPDGSMLTGQLYTGTYIDATADGGGDEEGLVRVMSWEHENDGLTFPSATDPIEGLKISGATSSSVNETDPICIIGTGSISPDHNEVALVTDIGGGTTDVYSHRTWVQGGTIADGAYANVEAGDIAMIGGPGTSFGSVKVGTGLVRHAVDTNSNSGGGVPLLESMAYVDAGDAGVFDLRFPTIKEIDGGAGTVTLEGVAPCPFGQLGECSFAATGNLYLILKTQYAIYDSSEAVGNRYTEVVADSVYLMNYLSVSYDPDTEVAIFAMNPTTAYDATGTLIDDSVWWAAATQGTTVSGMRQIPILTENIADGLPSNNLVGYWEGPGGFTAAAGFAVLCATNTIIVDAAGTADPVPGKVWEADSASLYDKIEYRDPYQTLVGIGTQKILIVCATPQDSTEWYEERKTPIYALDDGDISSATGPGSPTASQAQGVAHWMRFQGLESVMSDGFNDVNWCRLHFTEEEILHTADPAAPGVPDNQLTCFLPGDRLVVGTDVDPSIAAAGHFALSGVFLEPSFPRSTTNVMDSVVKVVSQGHPLTTSDLDLIGMRRNVDHVDPAAPLWYGDCSCYVRRIRRFHEVATDLVTDLTPLRYVYWTRTGYIDPGAVPAVGDLSFVADLATTGEATNLGNFDDGDVNINPGDVIRLLDVDGAIVDTAEVRRIDGSAELKLRTPGFTNPLVPTAVTFEIYLEQPIVPQQQSHDQLLDLLIDKLIHEVRISYEDGDGTGGHVEERNVFKDSTLPSTWDGIGVQEGDYLLIDPAGPLYIPESEVGTRPFGDTGTIERTDGSYLPGNPARLDDNRGFYRVEGVAGAELEVSGTSRFCGSNVDGADSVVFGASGSAEYVVMPTVHASLAPDGPDEGQQMLRITSPAVDDGSGEPFPGNMSFRERAEGTDEYMSIQPVGYRIIRPSPIFSQDATELVLFMRIQLLSWMEEIEGSFDRGGDYYIFQRDDHIDDLPSPTDVTAGLGILTNAVLMNIVGQREYSPFANVSDCVSILDRRFWILDLTLDSEFPPSSATAYTSFVVNGEQQRPVLVDHIDDALDMGDKFRGQRFSWVSFRADRADGSITSARREEDLLPARITKQRELAMQRKALETIESS